MAGSLVVDVVKFTAASAGSGSFVVSAAVPGYQAPVTASALTGSQYSYRAESADLSQWEVGQGTYTSSNVTITRTPLFNSAGGSSAITFTSPPQVGFVALAEDLLVTAQVSPLANSLSGNVAISSAGTYADGPTVAQGTVGTWFASGSITVTSTTGPTNVYAKLWDGTTVMDSGNTVVTTAGLRTTISLSGFITSPSGNIRISAADPDGIPCTMEFNRTGTSKDCTVSVFRIVR